MAFGNFNGIVGDRNFARGNNNLFNGNSNGAVGDTNTV